MQKSNVPEMSKNISNFRKKKKNILQGEVNLLGAIISQTLHSFTPTFVGAGILQYNRRRIFNIMKGNRFNTWTER